MTRRLLVGCLAWPHPDGGGSEKNTATRPASILTGTTVEVWDDQHWDAERNEWVDSPVAVVRHWGKLYRVPAAYLTPAEGK